VVVDDPEEAGGTPVTSPISVDAPGLASQAFNYLNVAQTITDTAAQGLNAIDSYSGVLGVGPASTLFLQKYGPAAFAAEDQLQKAGPALHDLAQAIYDWANAYIEADAAGASSAQGLQV
jgi:hypothetical protein